MAEVVLPVLVLGVDHHRTPLEIRERLAVGPGSLPEVVGRLRDGTDAGEVVLVSTCNRLECYLVGAVDERRVADLLGGGPSEAWLSSAYVHRGPAAVRHLFRVAAGLESLVLGEEQILGQVRTAYETARTAGWTGTLLNPLFQRALAVAKDVRTDTGIARHRTSIATVAVDLARQVHGDLAQARLLVLGAGEMAELTVRYLVDQGVQAITIVNRSHERAALLAGQVNAVVRPWEDLAAAVAEADLVVASTAAPHAVITPGSIGRRRRPLVLIDLAVPRDVDPAVATIDDVYVYNIDHLEGVIAAHQRLRQEEVVAAAALVEREVANFLALSRPEAATLGAAVATFFDGLIEAEAARLAARLGTDDPQQQAQIRYALERVAGKLSHRMHAFAKAHPEDGERVLREIIGG